MQSRIELLTNGSGIAKSFCCACCKGSQAPCLLNANLKIITFPETLSPLDANLPYADDFHQDVENEGNVNEPLEFNRSSNRIQETGKSSAATTTSTSGTAESEYNRILSEINDKQREEEEINAILQDWKLLAQKVDYILFWVFLALTTVSSCIFIFILPYFKRGKLL